MRHDRGLLAGAMALAALTAAGRLAAQEQPAEPAQPAEVAKTVEKAQVLETKASAEGDHQKPAPAEEITPAEAKAVDPQGKEPLDDAVTCLARTIYWEAKGEDRAAMEGIANVVMNRLGRDAFPNTVCGVVKEGLSQKACQFSWWCDGKPDDVEEPAPYAVAKEIAAKALNQQLPDRTGGAMYFHNHSVTPAWAREYVRTTELGGHLFYKPPGGKAK